MKNVTVFLGPTEGVFDTIEFPNATYKRSGSVNYVIERDGVEIAFFPHAVGIWESDEEESEETEK